MVGAGVIGASVAHHLAAAGLRDVVVVDRAAAPGSGSTARATGGFRAQFSTPVNVRLSLLARDKLLTFEEETGVDPGFRRHGYLFLARGDAAMAALREAQAVQHACGETSPRMITAAEAREISGAVDDEAVIGGAFSPDDGFIRPMEILRGYVESATRLGASFEFVREVVGLRSIGGRAVAVRTTGGEIATDFVVNAAGAWAASICPVPVVPLRRCVVPTVPTDALPESMPMTIWIDDGYHLRVRDGRVLLLWPDACGHGFATDVTTSWIDAVAAMTRARVAPLRGVPLDRAAAWAGLYEMSPDRHAVVGRATHLENVFLANGSSGHGVMHSPAIGQVVAEMIAGRPTSIDVTDLRPSRFAEGCEIRSSELL